MSRGCWPVTFNKLVAESEAGYQDISHLQEADSLFTAGAGKVDEVDNGIFRWFGGHVGETEGLCAGFKKAD